MTAAVAIRPQEPARHGQGPSVRRATLLAACLAFFVILLDSSIVNLALVRMREALRTDLRGSQWVVDGYALVFASLLLTGGSLADKFAAHACS